MSRLEQAARAMGLVEPDQLASALQRRTIYGGSLDTLLFEQRLVSAMQLTQLLEAASGLPLASREMLTAGADAPFDALPPEILASGWAVPLGRDDSGLIVGCHPEMPAEVRQVIEASQAPTELCVVPECILARLTGIRAGSIVPQRYALTASRFLDELPADPAGDPADDQPDAPLHEGSATKTAPLTAPEPTTAASPIARAPTVMGIPSAFGAGPGTGLPPSTPSAPVPTHGSSAPSAAGIPIPSIPAIPAIPTPGTPAPSPSVPSPSAPSHATPSPSGSAPTPVLLPSCCGDATQGLRIPSCFVPRTT